MVDSLPYRAKLLNRREPHLSMTSEFNPLSYVLDIERLAQQGGWSISYLNPIETPLGIVRRPWLIRALPGDRDPNRLPKVYLSAGIHGDETAGPGAMLAMLSNPAFFEGYDVTLFPILNPWGLAVGKRENADGLDLNRDYRNTKSAEIQGHIQVLETLGKFDAGMMLHEDYEGIGAYLFELNGGLPPGLGKRIVACMGKHVAIDFRTKIDDVRAADGVLCREDLIELHGQIEDRERWPEAIYLSVNHTNVSYTTETPMPFPIHERIAAQVAAVECLLRELDAVSSSSEVLEK